MGYAACFGLMIGGSDIFFVKLMRARFPNVNIDHAYSVWYCIELGTLWLSGIAAGWVFDLTGNYGRTLVLLVTSAAVAAAFTIGCRNVGTRTPGPRPIRSVRSAASASIIHTSGLCWGVS